MSKWELQRILETRRLNSATADISLTVYCDTPIYSGLNYSGLQVPGIITNYHHYREIIRTSDYSLSFRQNKKKDILFFIYLENLFMYEKMKNLLQHFYNTFIRSPYLNILVVTSLASP